MIAETVGQGDMSVSQDRPKRWNGRYIRLQRQDCRILGTGHGTGLTSACRHVRRARQVGLRPARPTTKEHSWVHLQSKLRIDRQCLPRIARCDSIRHDIVAHALPSPRYGWQPEATTATFVVLRTLQYDVKTPLARSTHGNPKGIVAAVECKAQVAEQILRSRLVTNRWVMCCQTRSTSRRQKVDGAP